MNLRNKVLCTCTYFTNHLSYRAIDFWSNTLVHELYIVIDNNVHLVKYLSIPYYRDLIGTYADKQCLTYLIEHPYHFKFAIYW